eukprot:scaffold155436_cov30-Tisochrysis_lutea.AAC.1
MRCPHVNGIGILCLDGRHIEIAVQLGYVFEPKPNPMTLGHEVGGDALRDNRIALVIGVLAHELAHPLCGRHELATCARHDEVEIICYCLHCGGVGLDKLKVGQDERHQPLERALASHDFEECEFLHTLRTTAAT